jgi:hypothetical protein
MLQHRGTIVKPLKFLVYTQHTSLVSNIVQEFFYFMKKFSFNSHDRIFRKNMIVAIDDQLLKENINTDLTNDGKRKSIIHIQDLGSLAARQKLSAGSR